jgi:diguanylate cyclase
MPNQAALRKPKATTTRATPNQADAPASLGEYRERITALAQRIRGTDDISSIIGMLNHALAETRSLRAKDTELAAARRKVVEAERSIESIRNELERVKAMLHQDPLTGMLNRRGIDEAFRQEASRCDRRSSTLCVAMLDIDDFKSVNDSFGHQVGDDALVHIADVVRASLRPTDRIGRFGGEEFLVLLPDTELKEAAGVLTRIKRELALKPLAPKTLNLRMTFSGGVTERSGREALEELLARADSALYQAKRAGKNRLILAR